MSVLRKLMRSPTATSFATKIISPLRLLLLTPVVLSQFNSIELDLFYVFGSALVMFSIFSARIGDVFVRMLSYAHAGATDLAPLPGGRFKGKAEESEPNWGLFASAYKTLGSLLLLAAIPSLLFAVVAFLWTIGSLTDWKFSNPWLIGAALIAALNSTIDITFLRYRSAAVAAGKLSKSNLAQVYSSLISIVCSTVVVLLGGGLFGLILTQFITSWLRRLMIVRLLPQPIRIESWRLGWNSTVVSWAWSPLWKSVISMMAGMGVERSAGLFLVSVGRPGFAAPFLMAQSLLLTISQLSSVPLQSQMPRFARMLSRGHGRAVVVQALARIVPQPAIMIAFVLVGSVLIPFGLEIIGSEIKFLSSLEWLLLGVGLSMRRFVSAFAQVYLLTNNMVFYLRTVLAGFLSLAFFYWGAKSASYIPFALGLVIPTILTSGLFSYRKMMELTGDEKIGCWPEAFREAQAIAHKSLGVFKGPARA